MKLKLSIIILFLTQQAFSQSYQKIHNKAILVDTHNDVLHKSVDRKGIVFDRDLSARTQTDLNRLRKGGVDVQVFSVWCDGDMKNPFSYALKIMDTLDVLARRNPGQIAEATNSRELATAVKKHKLATMFGVEGGHMMENNLKNLDSLYKRGARYMTLTWNNSTPWASSALDETFSKDMTHKGLTDFGRQVVHRMNELGMMVDVSHIGEQTFRDVMEITTKPVIASHSSVYHFCAHQRNLKDYQIRAIAENGGVIQVNFYSGFLDSTYERRQAEFLKKRKTETDALTKRGMPDYEVQEVMAEKYKDEANTLRPPLSLLIDHIDYIVKLVGVDYVGLGSDFDGIESTPQGLDDVTSYPLITKALIDKGYSRKDINKILGGNFLRVLKANESK